MKEKDLIEVLTFILNTQREQQVAIGRLDHIVKVLRAGANDEQEGKIEEFLRSRIRQTGSVEQSDDEITQTLNAKLQSITEKIRELNEWAADED
jgi:DNA-binding transcriptional MerR regulator